MFVVFLLHHDVTVGPPPSSADSAWFLTQDSGFAGHDDETGLPPLNPPGSSNRKPQPEIEIRFPFFCEQKKLRFQTQCDNGRFLCSANPGIHQLHVGWEEEQFRGG